MLENISLKSLQNTKINSMFEEGMAEIIESLKEDDDIGKKREITLNLSFVPNGDYVLMEMKVGVKTPKRVHQSIAAIEDKILKIDTFSNDVRQPDMFDTNVSPIKKQQQEG